MRRNISGQFVGAQLIAKADGTPITTGTTTVYVTGDAGTQATGSVGSGAATHEGQGFWTYAPAQAETNYSHVAFTFVNTNAINVSVQLYPLSYGSSGQMTGVELATAHVTAIDDLPTNAELATALGTSDDATLAAIATLQTGVNDVPTNAELATALDAIPTAIENADALLDRNMASGTDSGSSTIRTVRQALRALRNKWAISGTTYTVNKEDDSTASWTAQVTTNASADPITGSDPAS